MFLPVDLHGDLHGSTTNNGGARVSGRLVTCGVRGYVANVEPSVFDTAFVFENGKMVIETNIDMNGYKIIQFSDSIEEILKQVIKTNILESVLTGKFNSVDIFTGSGGILNLVFPDKLFITRIKLLVKRRNNNNEVTIVINHGNDEQTHYSFSNNRNDGGCCCYAVVTLNINKFFTNITRMYGTFQEYFRYLFYSKTFHFI